MFSWSGPLEPHRKATVLLRQEKLFAEGPGQVLKSTPRAKNNMTEC